jgi:hypothetical protein
MITQEKLKEMLTYNPDTGIFTWKVKHLKKCILNKNAGTLKKAGYITISIKKRLYLAHRLAWLYVYGEWPKNHIDHINGVRDDNRIENLRDVTQRQNCQNKQSNRQGKLVGTIYDKRDSKFYSRISIKNKLYTITSHETEQQAHEAYLEAYEFLKENGEQATIEKYKKKPTKGYCYRKEKQKWRSYIRINKRTIELGLYETKELAREAYLNKLKEIENAK